MIKSRLEHKGFLSFIVNFVTQAAEKIIKSLDQVRIRLILQLIIEISRVLQKLRKNFHGTAILRSFVLSLLGALSVIAKMKNVCNVIG